jgi:exonuclease SbcC
MPSLPPNSRLGTAALRTYLQSTLPDSQLTDGVVSSSYEPLLLLQAKHTLAGFAVANGDMRKSYEALYRSFKAYCAEQHGLLDTLDLAFVFCVQPGVPDLDNFCSNVETNVYFCRKFVVELAQPLGSSLARLPFLPLTPLHGQTLRPPSAQTFLQQSGVPAVLAQYLVVPGQRSPERIVEDCTSGTFGEPRLLKPSAAESAPYDDRAAVSVQLETVTIENFRAYRKRQTFELGADVTVLYGPNGFGKTSFFDAIDFGVTGGIGRIDSLRDANFVKTVQHLDSTSEDGVVSLSFRRDGAARKVTRTIRNRNHPSLDGHPSDRKAVLSELTGGDVPGVDRIANFVSLFRATHLFSQEQQELTKEFQTTCELPGDIVARMLAYEDYANALSKTSGVQGALKTVVSGANAEITRLSDEIAEAQRELDRLKTTAGAQANPAALDKLVADLRVKLAGLGLVVSPDTPDLAAIRGWRSSLTSLHAESRSRTKRLTDLAAEVSGLTPMRLDLRIVEGEISTADKELAGTESNLHATALATQAGQQRLTALNAKHSELQRTADTLDWIRRTKPVYAQLTEQLAALRAQLALATDALAGQREALATVTAEARGQGRSDAAISDDLQGKRAHLARARELAASLEVWRASRAALEANARSQREANPSLDRLRFKVLALAPRIAETSAEESRLKRALAEAEKNQSELLRLLSQLQGYITSGFCPLCGQDHGSRDELARRIQAHVAADIGGTMRLDLADIQERSKGLNDQIASNREEQEALQLKVAALASEGTRLRLLISEADAAAKRLDVRLDSAKPSPAEQLQSLETQLQAEVERLEGHSQAARLVGDETRVALHTAQQSVEAAVAEIAERTASIAGLEEQIHAFRADPRVTTVSLDVDLAQLEENARDNSLEIAACRAGIAKEETEGARVRSELSGQQQKSAASKAQLKSLRSRAATLQHAITQIATRLDESKLKPDVTQEELLAAITQEERSQAQTLALQDSTANLELAVDAAATSAAFAQIAQNVRGKERTLAGETRKRDEHQPWTKYFDDIARFTSSQQNDAVANFTLEYGPRTSVIQRRLRSVYGFDDIDIQSRDSAIRVRVRRRGEELRPTDYFSQSQQQTLLLGLFLTACISQTWSAFSPVFLDDPVTHFDDLNTYAFLDLIVGLLESNVGRRQFIMSTCDEELLQLAQQKLRHLGARAKFYRFSAIGGDGPVVDEVSARARGQESPASN